MRSCTLRHLSDALETQVEPRAMDVLSALCHRAGSILSADDLLHLCWDGIAVGENQVHKAVAQLRRALGDSASQPAYIENIRKRGYRTIAPVSFPPGHALAPPTDLWSRQSPYVGLNPFGPGHASVFFGRDVALARLGAALAARTAAGRPFVLVLGPSGSGKTSLVQAGMLPALLQGGGPLRVAAAAGLDLGDAGGLPLPTALGGALLDLEIEGQPIFAGQNAETLGRVLTGGEDGRNPMPSITDPAAAGQRFALFIDRLEVLFSGGADGAGPRARFLSALDRLARSGQFVIIAACRNDFYPDLAREPVLMEGKSDGGHVDLSPPARAEIMQMIRLPAQVADLRFGIDPETGTRLDDMLCDGVAENPDALPLLQYTLEQLYQQRSPARELTITAYRALGGIDGAIGRRADAILAGLPPAAQAALPRIFSLIVAVGGGDGAARGLRAPWSALSGPDERRLVQTFVDERLFVSLVHATEPVFGVAHEALLRQWPRAVAWIAEHHQALRIRTRLEGETQQWLADGRRADRLLRKGRPLAEAMELLTARTVPLSAEVTALINASARQARRADRLRLGAVAGFALVALVAVAMGFQARQAETLAAQRREEAEGLVDFMLGDLTEKLQPLAKLDLLDGVAQKAMAYLTAEDPGRVPGPLRLRQAKALLTLADVNRSRGNVDAALTALGRAELLLLANRAESGADGDLLKQLGAIAFWFGQIAYDQGKLPEAASQLARYRDYSQEMVRLAPDDVDAWLELSYALSSLGSLKLRRDEITDAAADFELSLELKRRAMRERPDDRALAAGLANGLSWLANARAQAGRLGEAADLYDQQRQVLETLRTAEPNTLGWSYRLALAHRLKGALLAAQGHSADAITTLNLAMRQIGECLAKEPANKLWRADEAEIGLLTARLYLANENTGPASDIVKPILAGLEKSVQTDPADDAQLRLLGQARLLNAQILLRRGDLSGAANAIGPAEAVARSIAQSVNRQGQKDKMRSVLLSNTLLARAAIETAGGRAEAAKTTCLEAADNLRSVAENSRDYRILDPWVRANRCGGAQQAAEGGQRVLDQIGYRDADYLRTHSSQPNQQEGTVR